MGITGSCLPSVLPDFRVSAVNDVKKDVASIQVEGGGLHGRDGILMHPWMLDII